MTYVITEPCIGTKDATCVTVCPADCIYEGEDQFYIRPDECIDCAACEYVCPVSAIFPDTDVPDEWAGYLEKNRAHFGGRPKSLCDASVPSARPVDVREHREGPPTEPPAPA